MISLLFTNLQRLKSESDLSMKIYSQLSNFLALLINLSRRNKTIHSGIERLQEEIESNHSRIMAIQMMQSHMITAIDSRAEES